MHILYNAFETNTFFDVSHTVEGGAIQYNTLYIEEITNVVLALQLTKAPRKTNSCESWVWFFNLSPS